MTYSDQLKIDYNKYKLDNGLEVILYQDKTVPSVSVNVWYRVGSANERNNKTGFAHLFEHMMFQGSKNIPKEGHFRFIQEAGGTLNGSTSLDRTNYFETLPANSLELGLWLESDRMGFLLEALTQEKLDNQKEVVMNERRQRYDNQPYGLAWEKLFNNLYTSNHPYSWPTIGWMSDIEKFELEDVREFFKLYYSPSNACLVVGGNFEIDNAKELVNKYFSEIKSVNNIPQVIAPEQILNENKLIIHPDNVQLERVYFAWHTVPAFQKFDATLDLLSDLLTSGKNSRLFNLLVYNKQIAQDVSSFQYGSKYAGSFILASTAKPGISLEIIKKELFNGIHELIRNGVNDEEMLRAKNKIKSTFVYSLQRIENIADHLNQYNFYLGNPDSFAFDLKRYESITKEEIIEAAKLYLTKPYVELQVKVKE